MTITRRELIAAVEDRELQTNDVLARLHAGEDLDLDETRNWLRANYGDSDGCLCPACGQHVQLRKRSISPAQVRALAAIAASTHADAHGWVDVARVADVRGGDYAKLRFWGLIEPRPQSTGVWRVTQRGGAFLAGAARVPRHVFVYNNRVRASDDDSLVGVRDIIGGNETLPESLAAAGVGGTTS